MYDLAGDPDETHNLIDSPEPTVQKQRQLLNAKLLKAMREIQDPALERDRELKK